MNKQYNFDEIIDRRGSNCAKWDSVAEGVLPMWIADMDFRTAPAVTEALRRRTEHGIFGYTHLPQAYYDAVCGWFSRRYGWRIDPQTILYTSGVVPAVSVTLKAMTRPGDRVAVLTPVYNCFFSSIRNLECEAAQVPLIWTPEGYRIDFEALERTLADPSVTVMLLCNPHNPGGRVWSRDELRRTGEICLRHGVFVVSDEIHCDLTFDNHRYTPYATLGEEFACRSASLVSPTKSFNIAGLQIANIVAADDSVRRRIDRAINIFEVCDVNVFGFEALIAAYNEGEEWFEALRRYIWGNYLYLRDFLAARLPRYTVMPLEGSYLAWIDCRAAGLTSDELSRRLESEAGLLLSAGTTYGAAGEGFMRLNMACPRAVLAEGLERFAKVVNRLTKQ